MTLSSTVQPRCHCPTASRNILIRNTGRSFCSLSSMLFTCMPRKAYLQNNSSAQLQILVGIFAVPKSDTIESSGLDKALRANLQNPITAPDLPIATFDYKTALQQYNISYIANLDFELNRKYAADPGFSLAFMNDKVSIYKVETNTTQSWGS